MSTAVELLLRGNGISLQKQDKLSLFPVTLWGQDHVFKAFLLGLNKGQAPECDLYLVSNKAR